MILEVLASALASLFVMLATAWALGVPPLEVWRFLTPYLKRAAHNAHLGGTESGTCRPLSQDDV